MLWNINLWRYVHTITLSWHNQTHISVNLNTDMYTAPDTFFSTYLGYRTHWNAWKTHTHTHASMMDACTCVHTHTRAHTYTHTQMMDTHTHILQNSTKNGNSCTSEWERNVNTTAMHTHSLESSHTHSIFNAKIREAWARTHTHTHIHHIQL